MSGESNVTSGAPGSPSHHHHHKKIKFKDLVKWINPVGEAIREKAIRDAKERDAEDATFQAELDGGVNADLVIDGEEWQQGIDQVGNAVFYTAEDWDGHLTYRKLMDRAYGLHSGRPPQDPPPFLPDNPPHAFVVHPDVAPAVAAVMARPGFWHDVECELKGHKGCHSEEIEASRDALSDEVEIKSIWTKIRHALEKADDKLDHAEDSAIGIKLVVTARGYRPS